MDQKICLDTDFIIDLIKSKDKRDLMLGKYVLSRVYTTAINVFELHLRNVNLEEIDEFLNKISIIDFDTSSAVIASGIYKELKSSGTLIEFRDIFIAAICINHNCELATLNKKHFSRIKNLKII